MCLSVISSARQSKLCPKSSTYNGYSTLNPEDFSSFLLEMTVVGFSWGLVADLNLAGGREFAQFHLLKKLLKQR
jgi:hypothetical protein